MTRVRILLVGAGCALLAGCGSGSESPADTWSQSGSTLRADWTVPSASSIDLMFTGATNMSRCTTTSNGRSEGSTLITFNGQPAAYIAIGKTLQAGARAQTTCDEVAGTVTSVSGGGIEFTHAARP